MFNIVLEREELITHKGMIIDATFVDAPRQRNSQDENKKIKNNEIPEEWKKSENAPKLAHSYRRTKREQSQKIKNSLPH